MIINALWLNIHSDFEKYSVKQKNTLIDLYRKILDQFAIRFSTQIKNLLYIFVILFALIQATVSHYNILVRVLYDTYLVLYH